MKIRIVVIAIVTCTAITCNSIEPTVDFLPYSIQCLVVADDITQTSFVYKTVHKNEYPNDLFVSNAAIAIANGKGEKREYTLTYDTSSRTQFYKANPGFEILPRSPYTFMAKIDGHTITGKATTPDTFSILEIKKIPSTVEHVRSYLVTWSKSNNAYYYKIKFINPWRTYLGAIYYQQSYYETADSSILLYAEATTQNDSSIVEVIAVDQNYYTAKHLKYQQSGVNGAYGFFAGGVRRIEKFVVK